MDQGKGPRNSKLLIKRERAVDVKSAALFSEKSVLSRTKQIVSGLLHGDSLHIMQQIPNTGGLPHEI